MMFPYDSHALWNLGRKKENLQKVSFSLKDMIRGRNHWHKIVNIYFLAGNGQICHFQTIHLPLETRKPPGCFTAFITSFIWKILKDGVKCRTTWELTLKNQKHIWPKKFSWNFLMNFGLQLMCTSLDYQDS